MHAGVELQIVVAIAGRLGQPTQLLLGGLGGGIGSGRRIDDTGGERHVDAHDVGLLRGEREHAPAATAEQEARTRLLQRLRGALVASDGVVLAGEGDGAVGEEALHDRDGLTQSIDAHARAIERDAGLLVVGCHPAGADAELEAAAAEQIDGRRLLGEHHRMAVVVAPHERADGEGGGGLGGGDQCGRDRPLVVEVVGDGERRIAEAFDPLRQLAPAHAVVGGAGEATGRRAGLDAEAEGLGARQADAHGPQSSSARDCESTDSSRTVLSRLRGLVAARSHGG